MPIDQRELIKAISIVGDNANVRVCVKQSAKGAIACGVMSFIGGVLLGPPGLAIGGVAGGLTAYKMTTGSYRPVGEILMNDLNERQQEHLIQSIQAAVADVGISDLVCLMPLLANNANTQAMVLGIVKTFLINELRLQIVD